MKISRRTFLTGSATVVATGAMPAWWARAAQGIPAEKLKRIGCTSVCFRTRFASTRKDKAPQPDDLAQIDTPRLWAEKLGLHNVEVWSKHFPDTSIAYCDRLRLAAERQGSRIINVQLDDPAYNLSDPDAGKRRQSIAFVKAWMDRAKACGAPSLRANTGRSRLPFDVKRIGDCFRQLAAYGEKVGVRALIENHGGYSSNPDNVVALVKYVDSPWCRTLPDFGNIPTTYTQTKREAFLSKLLPHAALISAKGMVFDADYRHQTYDVGACVRLAEAAGFTGIYSVELWAPNYAPEDPVRAIRSMVQTIAANIRNKRTAVTQ